MTTRDDDTTDRDVLENLAFLRRSKEQKEKDLAAITDKVRMLKALEADAKKELKQAQKRLDDAIKTDTDSTLFNGLRPREAAGGWGETKVTALDVGVEIDMKLAAVHIKTLGDLAVWHKDNDGYKNIPQMSPGEVTRLTEAMNAWFMSRIPSKPVE